MAQQKNSQWFISKAGTVLAAVALAIVLGSLSQTAKPQGDFYCAAVRLGLEAMSSAALTAWQTLHAHACAERVLAGVLQTSGALWAFIPNLAGAL